MRDGWRPQQVVGELSGSARYEALMVANAIAGWMTVESMASFTQFTLFGVLIALIHRERWSSDRPVA
jgi:hypothetical protein